MNNFSSIGLPLPVIPLEETSTKKTIKTETESGYLRTRSRSVRSFKTFNIKYVDLSNTNIQSLITFKDNNNGEAFIWQHPITLVNYNVVFNDDELKYSYGDYNRLECSFILREVW